MNGGLLHPGDPPPGPDPLARCIGLTLDEFAAEYWSRQPRYVRLLDHESFADLFSADAVDELVSRRGLRTPFLRMAKDGTVISERTFTRSGGTGATIGDQVADDLVLGQLADGATLVLQALHRSWPPLVEFGSALAAQLGHPVQINAYVTPPRNQGFAAHYDTHDVFVLQIAGTKRWVIHEPVIEHPLPDQPWDQRKSAVSRRARESPVIDQLLAPGDALYLPRGYLHAATAHSELSIHLTVGIHPITGFRLAEALVQALRDDPQLRRSLPVGVDLSDPDLLAEHLREVAAQLTDAAARVDDRRHAVAVAVAADLTANTRPAPLAPLAQLAAGRTLDRRTPVRQRPGLRRTIQTTAGPVVLRALGKTISMPAVMESALLVLLDGQVHAPDDLPGLDDDERLVLVRRLLREGVVVPARIGAAPSA